MGPRRHGKNIRVKSGIHRRGWHVEGFSRPITTSMLAAAILSNQVPYTKNHQRKRLGSFGGGAVGCEPIPANATAQIHRGLKVKGLLEMALPTRRKPR